MIADLHALTIKQKPQEFRERTLSFIAQYLACGLDPQKNTIFLQSHIPHHTELAWIFACLTPLGQLNAMAQFKEKSEKRPNDVNAGLYTYPVLMAADILLYQADLVPVGEDQRQHLELTRDIAKFFHNRYGEVFQIPKAYIPKLGAKIMSLQNPEQKMAKSDENAKASLFITDTPKLIQKKIKSAVTDSDMIIKYDAKRPGISNLLTIYSILNKEPLNTLEKRFTGKMYGDLKKELADLVCDYLAPVQKQYQDFLKNPDHLQKILKEGCEKAREQAQKTLDSVYEKTGLLSLG